MKLKRVVAFMSVLGLMSCPVLAAEETTTHHKYQKMKHHNEENYKGEEVGYKGEGRLVTCPRVNMYEPILDAMSHNVGRAKSTVDCDKPIQFAGGINFDTIWGNLHRGYMGENNTRLSVNDVYLNATGHVNNWVQGFLEISFNNIRDIPLNGATIGPGPATNEPKPGLYSHAYHLDALSLQQGYITIGNLEQFPLFLKLGKQFQDYGNYSIHPITRSVTQVMTETLQTSAELSFISGWNGMDLHGSFFVFENPMGKVSSDTTPFAGVGDTGHKRPNYGGQIGFGKISYQLGWDVGVGYMYDITGVNDIAYAVTNFHNGTGGFGTSVAPGEGGYFKRVDGLTAYGLVNSGPFSVSAHYATALKRFDSFDLDLATLENASNIDDLNDGAKPWAFDIEAGFGFNYWDKSQNLYVGYQVTGDAVNLYLPKDRVLAGYGIDVWKNTNVGLEYTWDHDYSEDQGGSGENTNRIGLRVGVKFG